MYPEHPAWIEHQRKRWLKPNALVYWRPQYAHLATPEEASLIAEVLKPAARRNDSAPMSSAISRAEEAREEWQRGQEILRLKSDIAWLRFERALLLHLKALERKANFDANQPRVPAGNPDGGQWSKEGEASGRDPLFPLASVQGAIGHNQGPPLEDPPPIPANRPATAQLRNAFIKNAARYLSRVALGLARGPVGAFALALEANSWIGSDVARIESYSDPPQSMEALQDAVSSPRWGYDIHHVAEQTSAIRDGFPPELVHGPENLVRIPTLKHWEINAWYVRPNNSYGGLTPRQFLQGKDWETRTAVGRQALVEHGLLKP